jgi:sulfate transport system permease protein
MTTSPALDSAPPRDMLPPPAAPRRRRGIMGTRTTRIIPGFPLTMGYTLTYLSLLVLIPLGALILKSAQLSWSEFIATLRDPVVVSAFKVTFRAAVMAAAINAVFGLLVAWVLVRYPVPGRRFFDAMIDFPFALPTAVAGLTFSNLYLPDGWIGGTGAKLAAVVNWSVALVGASWRLAPDFLAFSGTDAGIVVVLVFVGLPFVVRTVQPVLQEWDPEYEQAAMSLGATRLAVFRRVIFPELVPAWLSGTALSFARAVGEYGSVIFIASGIPGRGEIVPMRIVIKLDEYQYSQATAIAVVLLAASLLVLLLINGVEWWSRRHERART